MRIIRSSFAFCKVELLSGEKGYVALDEITAAQGLPEPSPAVVASSTSWQAETPEPRSSVPEAPLPEFEPTPLPGLDNPGN